MDRTGTAPKRLAGPLSGRWLTLLPLLLLAAGGSPSIPGLSYEHRVVEEGPLSLHILTVDPRRVEVFAGRALNDGVGRETVSSIARRKGALAGVNGGYFSKSERYDGDPQGILKIGKAWYSSSSSPSSVIGWKQDGSRTLIGKITVNWQVRFGDAVYSFAGINRARGRRERVLYSWDFHRSSLTDPGGLEVAIQDGKIVSMTRGGDCAIPVDGFVASFGSSVVKEANNLKEGMTATPFPTIAAVAPTPASDWDQMDYIVGGGPILLGPGVADSFGDTDFAGRRHPRTAVGVRADGTWVVLVVDGRQPTLSLGMSLAEVAETLRSLGCVAGLNLDGGGSTALYWDGKIVNSPSDFGSERMISDAILMRSKQP